MVAIAKQNPSRRTSIAWQDLFLSMLPAISLHARLCFRRLPPELREECIQEAICNACCAVARLAKLDKLDLAYACPLAHFAVAQVKSGRKVGSHLNCKDVLSDYCKRQKNITVERLDRYEKDDETWLQIAVEDKHAGPALVAETRIDFASWLHRLPRRLRRVATFLVIGETTKAAAAKFKVSAGRISQLRQELHASWQEFLGEVDAENRTPQTA